MAPHLRFTALLLIILLGSAALGRERIAQRLLVKSEWVTLEENSAVHFLRARNRFNGRIIKPLPKVQDSLRRRFYVEEQEVAFGEPVLIEYRVDGENWNETVGGNYRGSGRDENFAFLLRKKGADKWLPDRYGKVLLLGGLSVPKLVRPGQRFSYFFPLSRWSYPEQPGEYELHCVAWENNPKILGRPIALNIGLPEHLRWEEDKGLVESSSGRSVAEPELHIQMVVDSAEATPVTLPPELRKELVERGRDPAYVSVYKQFDLKFSEKEWYPQQWWRRGHEQRETWPDNKATAAYLACWYNPGEAFLPYLREELKKADVQEFRGLARNGSSSVPELLKEAPTQTSLPVLNSLNSTHRQALEGWLEGLYNEGEASEASQAKLYLTRWFDKRL